MIVRSPAQHAPQPGDPVSRRLVQQNADSEDLAALWAARDPGAARRPQHLNACSGARRISHAPRSPHPGTGVPGGGPSATACVLHGIRVPRVQLPETICGLPPAPRDLPPELDLVIPRRIVDEDPIKPI